MLIRTAQAEAGLITLWRDIALENPSAADRELDRIEAAFYRIADNPRMGPARPDLAADLRHAVLGRYLILYRLVAHGAEIVRVIHGARYIPTFSSRRSGPDPPTGATMAGHSQFKNIMHRKGAQDAKRARAFAKIIREITVSARQGMPDPAFNPRLRAAVTAARQMNMPRDTIERAIKKASGAAGSDDYTEVRYEGYGPAGVAVIVEALTDNRNRTASDVRTAFAKHGGALGETNSVAFLFSRLGVVRYPARTADEDTMLEAAIEAGADDTSSSPEGHEVTTPIEDFFAVRDALEARFGPPEEAKLDWRPTTTVTLDEDSATALLKLLDVLEDNDDVQNVYANFEIPEAVMAKLSA